MSFLSSASRKVTDVRQYLRDQATGNSIKYSAVAGETHLIYVPYTEVPVLDEEGNPKMENGAPVVERQLIAIQGNVHEWNTPDGKYHSCVCMQDTIREADGVVINDGTCPFCDRIGDGWDIYRMRKETEELNCKLKPGKERDDFLQRSNRGFNNERKSKEARPYLYILVVKFRTDSSKQPIMENGLPTYDLKVMKMSASRLTKIQEQIQNSGVDMPGSELSFGYPKTDDKRLVVGQSVTSVIFPQQMLTYKYPEVKAKIQEDVDKFSFEGIDKLGFPEWAGMTTAKAKEVMDEQFAQWDSYKKELLANPNAKYMEYLTPGQADTPSLGGQAVPGVAPAIPGVAPAIPSVPGVAAPVAPETPAAPAAPAMPDIPADLGNLFGNNGGGISI